MYLKNENIKKPKYEYKKYVLYYLQEIIDGTMTNIPRNAKLVPC